MEVEKRKIIRVGECDTSERKREIINIYSLPESIWHSLNFLQTYSCKQIAVVQTDAAL